MKVNYINTLLTVKDAQESKKFYTTLLGQEVDMDFGKNVTFKSGLCLHERSHFEGIINRNIPEEKYSNNMELYFETDEIKILQEVLEELKIEFIHKLEEQPWKQMVMRFYDLDGYIIEMGEFMDNVILRLAKEGKTIEEIAEETSISLDIVRTIVLNSQLQNESQSSYCGSQ